MKFKQIPIYFIVFLLVFKISWDVIGPAINNDLVVQDDFRQCCFWFWNAWDPNLFKNDFFVPIYQAQAMKSPLLFFIYRMAPLFSINLIFYSKFLSLIIAILTGLAGFIFFQSFFRQYKSFNNIFGVNFFKNFDFAMIDLISIIATALCTITIFCTDQITIAHARSFVWLFIFLYMALKLKQKNLWANFVIFLSLGLSPHAFLIVFVMEGLNQFIIKKTRLFDFKKKDFWFLVFNAISAGVLHLLILGGKQTQGVGTPFSVPEMKSLPEFNPGGRHPIFGSSLWDGSWWTNEHWGLGIGYLKISQIVVWAFYFSLIYLFLYLCMNKSKKTFYSSFSTIAQSQPAILFYASLILYFGSQLVFPILYLPSRYIAVSSLLLSVILIMILASLWVFEIAQIFFKKYFYQVAAIILIFLGYNFWTHFKPFYHARYVSIDARVNNLLQNLPADSLIAGHPLLPDLNVASITSKRSVFIDYERSMAYTKESLAEIRRRNEVAIKMVYAKDREEFINLAQANSITHFLAHYYFYSPEYLSNPVYIKHYDEFLIKQCSISGQKFFLQEFLEKSKQNYMVIDVSRI
jgi:hypothetical protein